MNRPIVRQLSPITALLVLMLLPGAAQAERERPLAEIQAGEVISLVWDAFAGAADVLVSMWEDNGPSLDPWGRPTTNTGPDGNRPLVTVPVDER